MDAVKYLKELHRMCSKQCSCDDCEFTKVMQVSCDHLGLESPEKAVEIVENWVKAHPVRTRQSVFLERYPNAKVDTSGNIGICPAAIEGKNCNGICSGTGCRECRSNYWNQEVPDDD